LTVEFQNGPFRQGLDGLTNRRYDFFQNGGNSHVTHASGTGSRALGEPFDMQFFDRCVFVGAFLVTRVERSIGATLFTMEFRPSRGVRSFLRRMTEPHRQQQ
jgi:hypothetical protein